MNWFVKTLVGAVLAGVGLKIGADVYEAVKKGVQQAAGTEPAGDAEEKDKDEDLEGAIETEVVELDRAEGR